MLLEIDFFIHQNFLVPSYILFCGFLSKVHILLLLIKQSWLDISDNFFRMFRLPCCFWEASCCSQKTSDFTVLCWIYLWKHLLLESNFCFFSQLFYVLLVVGIYLVNAISGPVAHYTLPNPKEKKDFFGSKLSPFPFWYVACRELPSRSLFTQ